jgi:Protein of unknown function (DUF3467)
MAAGQEGMEPRVTIDPTQQAGVWANWARVSHSPYEFTLDFVRLDFSNQPPTGVVVARVALSPLMVSQLIDALSNNWSIYAEKSMPREVQDDDRTSQHRDTGGPEPPVSPA